MNGPDRVVVVLGGLGFEDRLAVLDLDQSEAERSADLRLRELAGDHPLHRLESAERRDALEELEGIAPRVRSRAVAHRPTA